MINLRSLDTYLFLAKYWCIKIICFKSMKIRKQTIIVVNDFVKIIKNKWHKKY